jgi:hypothetical protein
MTKLNSPANPGWPDITRFEVTERVLGGDGGPLNRAPLELLERSEFLKKKIDDAVAGALTFEYANRLKSVRTITMTGDGSWFVSFDGSGNVTAAMTLADTGIAAGTYPVVTFDSKGRATAGRALQSADLPNNATLTGTPTAPTAAPGTNNLQIANAAFVQAAIAALVASSPAALDTLNELAAALGNDANFATTMTNALALKAPLDSPPLTGNPTAPTPAQFDNDTSLATTEFVQRSLGNYSDAVVINANTTLTAAHAGKYIIGSGTITLTLPDATTLPKGVTFHIEAGAAAVVTVATQNANTIDGPNISNSSPSSSFVLRGNTSSEFIVYSANQFRAVNGSGASSLAANGYQKLPSGLIIQWGAQQVPNATNQTYSFPLTWPNGCLGMTCSHHGADRTVNAICAVQSLSTFWLGHTYASSAQVNWHAFGY